MTYKSAMAHRNQERIIYYAKLLNISRAIFVNDLFSIYELEDLTPFLQSLKRHYQVGLTPTQLKQLIVLRDFIAGLLDE